MGYVGVGAGTCFTVAVEECLPAGESEAVAGWPCEIGCEVGADVSGACPEVGEEAAVVVAELGAEVLVEGLP